MDTPKRLVPVVLVMLALCLVPATATAATKPPRLDPPVVSTVEGLPVPSAATLDPASHITGGPFGGFADTYRLAKGVTAKALRSWYAGELPIGHDFGTWIWCESSKSRSHLQRTWARASDIITLTLFFEKGKPLTILVATEQSGPC